MTPYVDTGGGQSGPGTAGPPATAAQELARLRTLASHLPAHGLFHCFLDAEGRIAAWPTGAEQATGLATAQALGRPWVAVLGPAARRPGAGRRLLRRAAARGWYERTGWWRGGADGVARWWTMRIAVVHDPHGRPDGYVLIGHDRHAHRQAESLAHALHDEVERRVAERTRRLTSANRDLESFSYSVSHDLRSPLRHIASFVSLLEEHLGSQIDETGRKYLNTIMHSTRHMSRLIDALLRFSRTGRADLAPMPVDFGELVCAVVQEIDHGPTDGRTVEWVVPDDLPVVVCDAVLMREVWANLLGNAYKYTRPRPHGRIEVGWSCEPEQGYTFFVRDNGVGFDTQYQDKLFGVFQRLHRPSEFEGTGIGLALTQRIVERHGGRIWAESQLGEGSTFHFFLPFITQAGGHDATGSTPS
jgi:PAS domain S-box-containing protein